MIDVESLVFSTVAAAVESAFATDYPGLVCYGEYVAAPSSFPCLCLVEDDNYRYTRSDDDELQEHHANVMYTCNIYTNNANKKQLAKAIADVVDGAMAGMKFTRTMMNQIPNIDRTIYRVTMRYTAVVGEPIATRTEGDMTTTTYSVYRS